MVLFNGQHFIQCSVRYMQVMQAENFNHRFLEIMQLNIC